MAKTQRWLISLDDGEHKLSCTRSVFRKQLRLTIDGESFSLPKGAREEPFRLGDEQAILVVRKNGSVTIRMRDGEMSEEK